METGLINFLCSPQVNTTGYTAARAVKASSKERCAKTLHTPAVTTRTVSLTSARGTAASTAATRSV